MQILNKYNVELISTYYNKFIFLDNNAENKLLLLKTKMLIKNFQYFN